MELASEKVAALNETQLSNTEISLIKVILYFDIFDYPLSAPEVFENCCKLDLNLPETIIQLANLVSAEILVTDSDYYCLPGRENILKERKHLNERAERFWPTAKKMSRVISYFPFVEGVLITGSLSKNCMFETGDIDYMIITTPGRLWLCRGILTSFKKIALLNSRKYFCLNYYIDTETLKIPDENIFTATEISFARPAYNLEVCKCFFASNNWRLAYYPSRPAPDYSWTGSRNKSIFKTVAEGIFSGWLGEWADGMFFRMFVSKWKKKFAAQPREEYEINFRSRRNVSKHHPSGFQLKVLSEFEKRIKNFKQKHNINWP